MAAGDIIRSSLFTEWYNQLNSVVTKHGPESGEKTILMYSGNKNVGAGAGLQEMWRGTVPEDMTIKSVISNIYLSNSGGGATYAPRIYLTIGSTSTTVVTAGSAVNTNHTWSGSLSATKGQTISLWSEGQTGSSRSVTKFIYGALKCTPKASAIGTLNTGEVAPGNIIHASDLNLLITKYDALKADAILGTVSSLYTTISKVAQGDIIRWDNITKVSTTNTNIATITCRQTITNQTSCGQSYSQYYAATGCSQSLCTNNYVAASGCEQWAGCGNYHAATGCTQWDGCGNYHAATGCSQWAGCGDYHAATGCEQWAGCGDYHAATGCTQWWGCNQWAKTGCYQWRWYSGAICVGYCGYNGCWQYEPWCGWFVGVGWDCAQCSNAHCTNNYHAAWGCNNWWCVNNYHAAWGCNNWWCVNNYVGAWGCNQWWCVNNYNAAWGCNQWWCVNNYKPATGCTQWWCVNNYVAEHTNNITTGTVSNCSFTTTVKIR